MKAMPQKSGSKGDYQKGPTNLANKITPNPKTAVQSTQSTHAARPLKSGNKG